jgi:L-arabinose transport system substrate-binding protein
VPLVATDISIADGAGNPVPFVGFDGVAMGEAVGDGAAGLLLEPGWLEGGSCGLPNVELSTLAVCTGRTNATAARLIAAGAAEESVVVVPYDGTTDSALSATGPILTAQPDVDRWAVYSCNDGVLGAPNALRNAGFAASDVIGVGLGAYEACRPGKEGLETGFRSALFASGRAVGEAAARVLADSIRSGGALPAETIAPTQIVGPDTWEAIMSCG